MDSDKNKRVLVGKIYAKWCGHCKDLIPKWNEMKRIVKEKYPNRNIEFEEVEEKDLEPKLEKINREHLKDKSQKVELQEGYPTIFKISEKGVVRYYGGEREAEKIAEWALKEEEEEKENDKVHQEGGERKDAPPQKMVKRLGGKTNRRKFQKKRKTQKKKRSSIFSWFQ
jgi:thiol-disulfide isomerase/thioredoxin